MNDSLPVVEAKNLGKTCWPYLSQRERLLGSFINPRRIPGAFAFNALSGLNFELYPGGAIASVDIGKFLDQPVHTYSSGVLVAWLLPCRRALNRTF